MTAEAGAGSSDWKTFVRRHWGVVAVFAVAVALASAGAVYVFLWFAGNAQSTGLVPRTLGLWSIASLVSFILYAIFWELVLVGIPLIIGAVVAWQWWKRLPYEERGETRTFGKGSGRARGSGGLSFILFIAFCIKVLIDGRWDTPIATFTLDYVVGSIVTILMWSLIIIGIPAALGAIWWINRQMKKA